MCSSTETGREDFGGIKICCGICTEVEEELEEGEADAEARGGEGVKFTGEDADCGERGRRLLI